MIHSFDCFILVRIVVELVALDGIEAEMLLHAISGTNMLEHSQTHYRKVSGAQDGLRDPEL